MTQLHKFGCTREILTVADALGIQSELLQKSEAHEFIQSVLNKFHPHKITGHLSINRDVVSLPLEGNEFSYSLMLPPEPVYVFFDQEAVDKGNVVKINDGKELCSIMENAFGMEYFVSNRELDYLLAVNWHVIEVAGKARTWLAQLSSSDKLSG